MKPEYKNVSRSKRLIKEAVCQLLLEKDISKIRITEITALADINRGTFYAHYNDVYDVVKQIQDEFIQKLCNSIQHYAPLSLIENPFPFLQEITDYMAENLDFYKNIIQRNGSSHFLRNMKTAFLNQLFMRKENLPKEADSEELKLCLSYILSGCFGLLESWMNEELSCSFEELTFILSELVSLNLSKYKPKEIAPTKIESQLEL